MVIPKINSAHGSDTRNIINAAIESINVQGKSIQELVAKGQLSPTQYAKLLETLNGLISKGGITLDDLNEEVLKEFNNISPEFNLLSIPRDKSVTPEKTSFIKQSTNLFDPSTITTGKTISSQGIIEDNIMYNLSDKIPVDASTVYSVNKITYISFFDSANKFIERVGFASTPATVTTPGNSKYARISYNTNTNQTEDVQMNEGAVLLDYEKYFKPYFSDEVALNLSSAGSNVLPGSAIKDASISNDKLDFIIRSNNLFNIQNVTDNQGINVPDNNYALSDFITVEPNQSYTSIFAIRIGLYKDGQLIRIVGLPSVPAVSEPYTLVIPSNVNQVRLEINKNSHSVERVQINKGSELLPFDVYSNYIDPDLINAETGNTQSDLKRFIPDFKTNEIFRSAELMDSKTDVTLSTDSTGFYQMFDVLMSRNPDYISRTFLGNEVTGKPIYRYDFNMPKPHSVGRQPNDKPKILIVSGMHYEKTAIFTVFNTMQQMTENWQSDEVLEFLKFNVHFVVVPVGNPYGIDNIVSRNSNNVDVYHNFPTNWEKRPPDHASYRGEYPLSELEAQYINDILENEELFCAIDFHNFFGTESNQPDYFVWTLAVDEKVKNIADSNVRALTRKWRKDYNFIPDDINYFSGYTTDTTSPSIPAHAVQLGAKFGCIFEVGEKYWLDTEGGKNDSRVLTMGLEAFVNLLNKIMNEY